MTTKKTVPKKLNQVKHSPLKSQNYYGVFNHMIEDNISYLTRINSTKSKVIGWLIYALIILLLTYIFFTS
jgi:hypothetical protein